MTNEQLTLKFDPQTIKHLGIRMYSSLSSALSELISNSYDADASFVKISLSEVNNCPAEIKVEDNGNGLSYDEINNKFLIIGRNRRIDDEDSPSPRYNRYSIGKKGLGKLALFGLGNKITISTIQNKKINEFILDWDSLMTAEGAYHPQIRIRDESTSISDGTTITISELKRKSHFDVDNLANSLSKIFIFDNNFKVEILDPNNNTIEIDNNRKYTLFDKEFEWSLDSKFLIAEDSEYHGKLKGVLISSSTPLKPLSGLRGITLLSRGKLVNAPEFFSNSTSSHFYQYITGWISADFIDNLEEDVISTNRQSIDWEHPEMSKLRCFLSEIVSKINIDWRQKRKEKRNQDLLETTGINTIEWLETLPLTVRENTNAILSKLQNEEVINEYASVIQALHEIIPEYAELHWRFLHEMVKEKSKQYYKNKDYYSAFIEALKKYSDDVKSKSGSTVTPDSSLMGNVFNNSRGTDFLSVIGNYKKQDGRNFTQDTISNVQNGQQYLSQGIVWAGRNPLAHEEIEELYKSDLFSEKDCLDLLSLLSHLYKRLDNSIKV